ncbi:hypothetical protein [Azonexus hydrophilus]|uniref:hypothetical protein n=1 Tax=Azonexus hydrophilus TaxID=418702 RepID=UPI0011159B07|nr:hypothetical protein [Azonexus hydrophilus]
MIRYIHFAYQNLYLVNGYREFSTSEGVEREYELPDQLEQCIRGLVLRKNEPLRGWDLRFLRRGLGFSQAELGLLLDRDAQTVARWEKKSDPVPKFADITIRTRFAARYEPNMTVSELIAYVDGCGKKLPDRVMLSFFGNEWHVRQDQHLVVTQETACVEIADQILAWVENSVNLRPSRKLYDVGCGYSQPIELDVFGEENMTGLVEALREQTSYKKLGNASIKYSSIGGLALVN